MIGEGEAAEFSLINEGLDCSFFRVFCVTTAMFGKIKNFVLNFVGSFCLISPCIFELCFWDLVIGMACSCFIGEST